MLQFQETIDFSEVEGAEFNEFRIHSSEAINQNVLSDLARMRGLASANGTSTSCSGSGGSTHPKGYGAVVHPGGDAAGTTAHQQTTWISVVSRPSV